MRDSTKSDNLYPEGALITAKENPSVKLRILKYYRRIYYCAVVGDERQKQRVYFAHELTAPVPQLDDKSL